MKVYKNLVMKGEPDALRNLLGEIESHLSGGWSRDTENEVGKVGILCSQPPICFAFPSRVACPEGWLWMTYRHDREVLVTSIAPKEFGSLTFAQFNQVMDEFFHRFVEPFAAQAAVQIELTSEEFHLEDVLSEQTANLLRTFSRLTKSEVLHSFDERKWDDFIIAAHKEDSTLDGATLHRWLTEEENWTEEAAWKRTLEYEFARSLLGIYVGSALAA